VAHGAVDGLEFFLVRQLDTIKVAMAIDATEIGMNGRCKRCRINKDRYFVFTPLTYQIRVFVTHQTVFVLLRRRRNHVNREQQGGGNDADPPQSSEFGILIVGQSHSLLQIRAEKARRHMQCIAM